MPDQTPVQIAWVTRDLDATEKALTSLLGAKKWIRMPGVHFAPRHVHLSRRPADFVADISSVMPGTSTRIHRTGAGESIYTEYLDSAGAGLHHICVEAESIDAFDARCATPSSGRPVVQQGVMPGGMRFAYVSAEQAGVPYIEIAYIPDEIRAFFDYVKLEQQ